jgi:hypothetical protein
LRFFNLVVAMLPVLGGCPPSKRDSKTRNIAAFVPYPQFAQDWKEMVKVPPLRSE